MVYVSAPGLACAVGLDAEAACAAIRAGIAQFEELPYRDNVGEPVIGAMVPGVDPGLSRARRLLELLALALQDTLARVPSLPLESIPLIVCLAEPDRPGGGGGLGRHVVGAVEERMGVSFHPDYSGAVVKGNTSGFRALRVARRLMQEGDIQACLICAADSFINARSLHWLDRHWRLKTEENSDGVIPGEAAAALLVTPEPAGSALRIRGVGFATEPAPVLSEEPMLGLGLTEAARKALVEARLNIADTSFRLSDVTGEHYGFKEQALAIARLMRSDAGEYPIWHVADCIGDTGAVAGLCQLVLAQQAFEKGFAPGPRAIGFAGATSGGRAAVVVEHADG